MATSPRRGPQSAPSSYRTASGGAAAFADQGAQAHAVAFRARGGWPGRTRGPRVVNRPGFRRIEADALAGGLDHLGDGACRYRDSCAAAVGRLVRAGPPRRACANGCVAANAGASVAAAGRRRTSAVAHVR